MAQDLGQDFTTGSLTTVAGLAATVAATANDDATEINFGTTSAPLAINLECLLPMLTGTPDGNQQIVISFKWGASTGNTDDANNVTHQVVVNVPTASVTFNKTFRIPVLAQFCLINVLNDQAAGPTLNSTYTLKYSKIYGDQA